MEIDKHITELFCPFYDLILPLCAVFFKFLFQRSAFDIIHYNKKSVIVLDYIHYAWQIWVVELFKQISLNDKALLYDLKVLYAVLSDLLYSPLLVGLFVHRKINDAHSALTYFIEYFIFAVNNGTDRQHICKLLNFPIYMIFNFITKLYDLIHRQVTGEQCSPLQLYSCHFLYSYLYNSGGDIIAFTTLHIEPYKLI